LNIEVYTSKSESPRYENVTTFGSEGKESGGAGSVGKALLAELLDLSAGGSVG